MKNLIIVFICTLLVAIACGKYNRVQDEKNENDTIVTEDTVVNDSTLAEISDTITIYKTLPTVIVRAYYTKKA